MMPSESFADWMQRAKRTQATLRNILGNYDKRKSLTVLSYSERVRERVRAMPQAAPNVPVNELYPDRYGVGRTKLYEFLKRLNISPFKPEGDKRGHITIEQLQALDTYVDLLGVEGPKAAQAYADRLVTQLTQAEQLAPVNASVATSALALPPAMELIVEAIAHRLQPNPQPDLLAAPRQLQEAADHNWQLRTREIKAITNRTPQDGLTLYGFRFHRAARGWWAVKKLQAEP